MGAGRSVTAGGFGIGNGGGGCGLGHALRDQPTGAGFSNFKAVAHGVALACVGTRAAPLDFARDWQGKHKRKLTSDLDQALVLIGACVDGSGINASDTLKNENFKPHVALKPLLEWLQKNGADQTTRNAASRAVSIYNAWHASLGPQPLQASLFDDDGEYGQ